MDTTNRNYGIDLLRIISMYMIVLLHVLGQGGILVNAHVLSPHWLVAWFIEIISYVAVNCYGLISGFVGLDKEFKLSKVLRLWTEVAFYTIGIMLIFLMFYPNMINRQVINGAVMPITSQLYWYISAYFGIMFLMPIINKAVKEIDEFKLQKILFYFALFCIFIPAMNLTDPLTFRGGYSAFWLLYMYLVGAYFKRYSISKRFSIKQIEKYFCITTLLTFLLWCILHFLANIRPGISRYNSLVVDYTAPLIFLSSLLLFIYFVDTEISNGKMIYIINNLASTTLGVYLIHVNPLIWKKYMKNFSVGFLENNPMLMALKVLLAAIVIYLTCSMIDRLRIYLFKYLGIYNKCNLIANYIEHKIWGEIQRNRKICGGIFKNKKVYSLLSLSRI